MMAIEWVQTEFCRVACCDCREALAEVKADAVVTDPPYGMGYSHGGGGGLVNGRASLRRFVEPIAGDDEPFDPTPFLKWPCLLFGADHYCNRLPGTGTMHVWDKAYSGGPDDSFSNAELFWTSKRQARIVIRYLWKGVCQDGEKGRRKLHQSQKPIEVMRQCLALMDADTVFDPFMGSGTTAVACILTGLKFIGCEIDRKYFDIALKRIREAEGEGGLFHGVKASQAISLFDEKTGDDS